MERHRLTGYSVITYDIMFLTSFLLAIAFSVLVFLDLIFLVPAIMSFSFWLILTLMVLRKRGVSVKHSILDHKLVSGLPMTRKLHLIYVGTLLVSLMLFFGLMLVAKEIYLLFAFMIWLLVGSLVMQELGGDAEPKKEKNVATH